MSKKTPQAPIITEETTEQAEQVQEAPEQSRKDIALAMWNNAKSELARIADDRTGLEQLIEDKTHQRRLLIEQRDQADDHHQAMAREEAEAAGRVTRENSRLQIAKGTGAEAEHEAILQSLIADLDQAKSRTEEAAKARDNALERARLIPALDTAVDEIGIQLADLDRQEREMQAVKDEQHQAYGAALADEIKADIESAKQTLIDYEEGIAERKRQLAETTNRINELKREWPHLHEPLLLSHSPKAADLDPTPTEHVIEAYRTFIMALLEHGAKASTRVLNEKVKLVDFLVIDAPTIVDLARTGSGFVPKRRAYDAWGREIEIPIHQKLEVIEEMLKDQKRYRGSTRW